MRTVLHTSDHVYGEGTRVPKDTYRSFFFFSQPMRRDSAE